MNAEFLAILEYWEREKGINKEVLVKAVEEALLSAAKKAVGPARELRCAIDPKTGDIRAFAKLVVSEKVASKHDQISVFDARRLKPDAQLGDEVEVEVTPARMKSKGSRASPVSAPSWRYGRATKRWIQWARVSACAGSESKTSSANSTTRRWTSSSGTQTSEISSPTRSRPPN